MMLGLDTFSLRSQAWDAFQLMDYAASLGLRNVQFSERAHLGSFDVPHLQAVRARADELGLRLEIGMRSFSRHSTTFDPELGTGAAQLSDMLRAAHAIGSGVVRCFFGMAADRLGETPVGVQMADGVRTLREVAPLAESLGVRIAVENHGMGDLLASELREVIEAVGSDHVGVCFDAGNPTYAAEDPVYAAQILAPYVVTSHIRDTRVWGSERGAMVQWVPVGAGNVDLRRLQAILPDVAINLEIITGGAPREILFLDDDAEFWRMYPAMTARSLAAFLALAERGTPEPFAQHLPSDVDEDTMRRQQREHLEQSVRYCQDMLGVQAAANAP